MRSSGNTSPVEPRARILVVEDDTTVSEVVTRYLEREGFGVETVADGQLALERVSFSRPDLVVLDVMLPHLNGFDVCRRLEADRVPIVFLTARGEEGDRLMGLQLGADDYVTKPFSPRELVARIKAVLRRAGEPAVRSASLETLSSRGLELDRRSHEVRRDGERIGLTTREFDLLVFLMSNPGRAFSRDELLERVWGYTFGDTSTVTVHVQRLRKKIESEAGQPVRIRTVWGVGYRFEP